MADMVALFSNVGSHVPFFKKEHMHKAIPESLVSSKIITVFVHFWLLSQGFNAELQADHVHAACFCEFIFLFLLSFCKNWLSVSYRWRWWLVPSGFLVRATSSTVCMGAPLPMMSSTDTAIFRFFHFHLWLVFFGPCFCCFILSLLGNFHCTTPCNWTGKSPRRRKSQPWQRQFTGEVSLCASDQNWEHKMLVLNFYFRLEWDHMTPDQEIKEETKSS